MEVESYIHELDSLQIDQSDSSRVVFEMSPDLKGTVTLAPPVNIKNIQTGEALVKSGDGWKTIFVKKVNARISGISILDLGNAQINSLQLQMADSSAIILSGNSLKKWETSNH